MDYAAVLEVKAGEKALHGDVVFVGINTKAFAPFKSPVKAEFCRTFYLAT